MNPCPQGFDCDLGERCQCTPEQRVRHRRRLSAPLIDRIDIAVEVPRLPTTELVPVPGQDEDSATVGARVAAAHGMQQARQGRMNSQLSGRELDVHAPLGASDRALLERAVERFRLSARAYHRILRVARSIADLAGSTDIGTAHLTEALGFRALDRWRLD
jgi:magnesium chelatase family protein